MPLTPQHTETLEKAGGLILDQLVAAGAISAEQQSGILQQQQRIEQETGEKRPVGELLEENGMNTAALQPLLNLQATARTLLHAHGKSESALRCEGRSDDGSVDLLNGIPDNKRTLEDMESRDPAREYTALLQLRLSQTKTLTAAANMLQASGQDIPASTLNALLTTQNIAHQEFGAAIQSLPQQGQSPSALEAVYADLPKPGAALPQKDIHKGVSEAIGQLQQTGLLNVQQAKTLRIQEFQRSNNISKLQAREQARSINTGVRTEAPPPGPRSQAVLDNKRGHKPGGPVPGF